MPSSTSSRCGRRPLRSQPARSARAAGARAGYEACLQAVLTHGGFGYAKEYHVERLLREVMITRIAPITEQLILSFVAEKVLDLPKSY
jgi:acyl-CoA dehydrogenase